MYRGSAMEHRRLVRPGCDLYQQVLAVGIEARGEEGGTSRRHSNLRALGASAVTRRGAVSTVATVFAIAVALNFMWEIGQSFLFAPMGNVVEGTWRCFRASLWDGLIVALLFGVGGFVFGRRLWIMQSGALGYAFIAIAGVLVAVATEWLAVRSGYWAYQPHMPRLPRLAVGLAPVLQMAVLPALSLRLAAAWELGQP